MTRPHLTPGLRWNYLPACALLIGLLIFGRATNDLYFSTSNLSNLVVQGAGLGLVAIGQTFVTATAGLDISTGAIVGLVSAFSAVNFAHLGVAPTILVGLLIGVLAGVANGIAIAYGLQPLLVTLATLTIFQGVAVAVLPQPGGTVPAGLSTLSGLIGNTEVPTVLPILIALAAAAVFVLRRTKIGLRMRAAGSDIATARVRGLPASNALLIAYGIAGLFDAMASVYLLSQTLGGDPLAGSSFTLDAIAAVVLGGNALTGGRVSVVASCVGAAVLVVLNNALNFAHISSFYQELIEGALLILALSLPGLVRRVRRLRPIPTDGPTPPAGSRLDAAMQA